MNTRIKLRRTNLAINQVNDTSIDNRLRDGEALYSFYDNMIVVGRNNERAYQLPRIYAFDKIARHKIFAGPVSTSSNEYEYPTFRDLRVDDLPTIPSSKISGLSTDFISRAEVKNKGSLSQPIYFNAEGVATPIEYTINKSVPSDAIFKYISGAGIDIQSNVINNSGVRSVTTGSIDGTISVNTNGVNTTIPVKGLGTAAYKNSSEFASANHIHFYAASGSAGGPATSAIKLNTGRLIKVKLNSQNAVRFDGTSDINIGVEGVLPISHGGTGVSNLTSGGVVYDNDNQFATMTASAANQVLMSNTISNYPPVWKNATDVANFINWRSITSWQNTYLWESMSSSSQSWIQEYGSIDKYTNGITSNTIHLLRGSLQDIILNKNKVVYYEGTGIGIIYLNLYDLFGYIPRKINIYSSVYKGDSQAEPKLRTNIITIDLSNLYLGYGSTSSDSSIFQPSGVNQDLVSQPRWRDSTCKSITFELSSASTGSFTINLFNQFGKKYLCADTSL